ncbi:MAG TPA: PAAR domain-containing protein [Pseudomonas sp.]|nr:PAAR domain-containing protein [Pseudomonas sp.]
MRALACLGDKTTYGEVISATATWFEEHKPIAQTGDLAWCSKCQGSFPVSGTAFDWSEQQPYVATGDQVLCGCSDHMVFGSTTQYTAGISTPLPSTSVAPYSAPTAPGVTRFAKSFAITDTHTGLPVANRAYIVLVDGYRKVGVTDAEGMATIYAPSANSVIEMHVVFQAPCRDLTELSEDIA